MSAPTVSVIVVSRGRPALLPRCLIGIGQLCHRDFEIVVVADAPGVAAVRAMGWEDRIKLVPFDEPNISAARNAGLVASAGDIVAFIDDDAVPEPTWLGHLTAPFDDPDVSATGGYVIGRNGVSFQWTARAVNSLGEKIALPDTGEAPFEPRPPAGFVPKTEGTNCAFRRDHLARLGGFDPAFRFYLDETDLNLRLARSGARTFMVPLALVHHGYAASARRTADRAPRDLGEIGASTALFLRKHAPDADAFARFPALHSAQRRALLRHMVAGRIAPGDVGRLLDGFAAGFAEGQMRAIVPLPPLPDVASPFRSFTQGAAPRRARVLAGRPWTRQKLRQEAARAVAGGDIVTVFRFSPTALPHRVRFHPGGWWEQVGGLFGPTERSEKKFRLWRFRSRLAREWERVAMLRQCP